MTHDRADYADYVPFHVEHRPTRVTSVNRSVRLEKLHPCRILICVQPMPSTQMAGSERLTDAERCANYKNLIADFYLVRVADNGGRDALRHLRELQQSHIRPNIRADNMRGDLLAVGKLDRGHVRCLHNVGCG